MPSRSLYDILRTGRGEVMRDKIFKSGQLVYAACSIDFARPFAEQADNLTEDLRQVSYGADLLLDAGWYPEGDAEGGFIVQLIRAGAWDDPLYKHSARQEKELQESIEAAALLAESLLGREKEGTGCF